MGKLWSDYIPYYIRIFAVDPESASCKKSEVVFALKKFFLRIWPTYMVCVLITYLLTQIRELPGRTYGLKELITNWLGINHLLGMPYIDGAHWYLTVLTAMFLVVLLLESSGSIVNLFHIYYGL